MPEVICNTSPLQYLHQLRLLHILPALARLIFIPPSVREEVAAGRAAGVDLPDLDIFDWLTIRIPKSTPALRLVTDLGPGETEVLALGLESPEPVVILDDGLARAKAVIESFRELADQARRSRPPPLAAGGFFGLLVV